MYASLLGISGVLHLDVLDQPAKQGFFSDPLQILNFAGAGQLEVSSRKSKMKIRPRKHEVNEDAKEKAR